MPKIPEKFMGLLGKFADSLDYKDLPQDWANNKQIVAAAEELYRDMGTKSPFFRAWSGDKYKRKDPEVFYHGTDNDFSVFESGASAWRMTPGEYGPSEGIWFADSRGAARDYGENVMPVFLDIRNPLNLKNGSNAKRMAEYVDAPHASGKIQRGQLVDLEGEGLDIQNEIMKQAMSDDYDSVITNDWNRGDKYTATVVFNPTQIKSTSNRGTFNPADPDIYRSAAPLAVGAGAGAAAMGASDAQASAPYSVPSDIQAQWNAFRQSGKLPEKPLEAPVWSPADLAVAPIGAATTAGKAAAMAADPLMSYGADKLGGLLGYFWGS